MVKYDPAPGEESSVALALANTLRRGPTGEVDHLVHAHNVEGWVAEHRLATQPLRFSESDVGRLTELRAAVRELFTAAIEESAPDSAMLATINGAAAGAPGAAQLRWHPLPTEVSGNPRCPTPSTPFLPASPPMPSTSSAAPGAPCCGNVQHTVAYGSSYANTAAASGAPTCAEIACAPRGTISETEIKLDG